METIAVLCCVGLCCHCELSQCSSSGCREMHISNFGMFVPCYIVVVPSLLCNGEHVLVDLPFVANLSCALAGPLVLC